MDEVTEDIITKLLKQVPIPGREGDLVSLGLLSGLVVQNGIVRISIEAEPDFLDTMEGVRLNCQKAIAGVPGVLKVTAVLSSNKIDTGPASSDTSEPEKLGAAGVKSIIAVASGKGGVGKSTTAVNLALALARRDKMVGILDADIYGPSIPRMMGVDGQPKSAGANRLQPLEHYGIKCMSMGFLVQEEEPMIWRGPMVMSAMEQMLNDVIWAPLDFLIVDMPPGTGDIQLTLAQSTQLAGAVMVSTPQDIALLDTRKGINMFRRVQVPILGIIENMSYFICPHCGDRSDIFASGGAERLAKEYNSDFLGAIPLDIEIRETSDAGRPIVISKASGAHALAYMDIAQRILGNLKKSDNNRVTPKITIV